MAGALIALAGTSIAAAGLARLRRLGTTPDPIDIESATKLATDGIYRWTRNPMYLGMILVLVGWALALGAALAWVGPPAFALYIQRFQIVPEEAAMARKFGEDFERYRKTTRRWL